jgi:hypothetical protein
MSLGCRRCLGKRLKPRRGPTRAKLQGVATSGEREEAMAKLGVRRLRSAGLVPLSLFLPCNSLLRTPKAPQDKTREQHSAYGTEEEASGFI